MTAKIKSALECAAGILLRRQHTVSELTNKLRKKGVYAKSQIDEAIAELETTLVPQTMNDSPPISRKL